MLAALLLAPQTIKADDCQFTPAALPGQTSDRTAYEINVTMQVGDGGMVSMQYGSLQNLATTNANVAALHSRGMGVYMVGVGTADVTYSEQVRIDRTNSCTTDHTIHYTVQKGNPVAYFAGADGSALTEYNLALQSGGGDAAGGGASTGGGAGGEGGGGSVSYWTPGLVMNIKSFTGMGFSNQAVTSGITYASSNPSVAAIDASTGAVTVQGIVGETTISATWAGDANWNGTPVSYNLIVKKQATMYFNPGYATDTVGNTLHLEPIINTPGVTVDAWESSNEAVATVDNSGNVTMVHFGNAYIDAIFNGNNEYAPTRCRFYLTVSKRQPHISFTPEVIRLEKNVTVFEAPVMNKPADLTQTKLLIL